MQKQDFLNHVEGNVHKNERLSCPYATKIALYLKQTPKGKWMYRTKRKQKLINPENVITIPVTSPEPEQAVIAPSIVSI